MASAARREDNVIASQGKWASWLLAPTIVALSIVIVYPIISAIVMSFQADAGLDPATGLFTEGGPAGCHGRPFSLVLTLPPLAALLFVPG
jgi:hypothetical protein